MRLLRVHSFTHAGVLVVPWVDSVVDSVVFANELLKHVLCLDKNHYCNSPLSATINRLFHINDNNSAVEEPTSANSSLLE